MPAARLLLAVAAAAAAAAAASAASSSAAAAPATTVASEAPQVFFNVTSPTWSVSIGVPFVANASLGGKMNAWSAMLQTQHTSPQRLVIHYAVIPPLYNRTMEIFVNGLGSTKENLLSCSLDATGTGDGGGGSSLRGSGGAAYCWSCADNNVTKNSTGITDMLLLPGDEVEWSWRCYGATCPNVTSAR